MAKSQQRQFLSVREYADALGVSRQSVLQWVKDGRLPAVRPGPKVIRIPASELQATVSAGR